MRRPRDCTLARVLGGGDDIPCATHPGCVSFPHGSSSYVTRSPFSSTARAGGSHSNTDADESPKIVTCCSRGALCATALAVRAHARTTPARRTKKRVTATNVDGLSAVCAPTYLWHTQSLDRRTA